MFAIVGLVWVYGVWMFVEVFLDVNHVFDFVGLLMML